MPDDKLTENWTAVIGRSLAYLALDASGLGEKDLATRGQFLENLGLSRREAASVVGTTAASLTELYRQARARKGKKSGKKKTR
jgi:C4-dicarboxylate transporter